jgi:hypothetical protein
MNENENDIILYIKYKCKDNCIDNLQLNETSESPMHPNVFYNLSQVHNFNNINGESYEEYITIWKKRYKIIDIHKIKVVVIKNDPYQTVLTDTAFINNEGKVILPFYHITTGIYEKLTNKSYHNLPIK